jgi:DNA-binding transcriptional ArsR family regulator
MNDSTATTPIKTGIDATDSTNNAVAKSVTDNSEQRMGWRSRLTVHPAAELFLPMSDAELRELADDIEANGLREPIAIYADPQIGDCILDGRNRLDALELLGRTIWNGRLPASEIYRTYIFRFVSQGDTIDPVAYVISRNIRRRHLKPEERADLIAKLLKLSPEKSNRRIAAELKVDHKKVGAVRRTREATGEITPVEKTTGKDGKKRPARRPIKSKANVAPPKRPVIDLVTYDLANLKKAMAEVEAQALAGNNTRVKEALRALRQETDRALEANCIIATPPPEERH